VEKRKIQSRVRKKKSEEEGDQRKNKGRVGVFSGEKRGVFLGGEWGNLKERGKRKEERKKERSVGEKCRRRERVERGRGKVGARRR
jgi:hypothetical protein